MKILVTTPTGNIGRRVLAELLAPEFSVRIITRSPTRLPEDIHEQVEIVQGSTDDVATLRQALDGIEAFFWCIPSAPLKTTNMREHYERFARAAGQAIHEAETPRVVTVSASGKSLARNAGPISGAHAMEEILNESGAAIRHLRGTWFMENFLGQAPQICNDGVFSYPIGGDIPLPMIAAADLADVALRWLVRGHWGGVQAVAVRGPQDLTCNAAAAVFEQVLERPVRYVEQSADDYIRNRVRSGATVHYASRLAAMFSELRQGIFRTEATTPASVTPTNLSFWAESELLPLVEPTWRQSEAAMSACSCR